MNLVSFSLLRQHQGQRLGLRRLDLNLVLALTFTCCVTLTTHSTALSLMISQGLGWMISMVLSDSHGVVISDSELLSSACWWHCFRLLFNALDRWCRLRPSSTCPSNGAKQPCRLAKAIGWERNLTLWKEEFSYNLKLWTTELNPWFFRLWVPPAIEGGTPECLGIEKDQWQFCRIVWKVFWLLFLSHMIH